MRKNGALLLSVLLAMSFLACASLGAKSAKALAAQPDTTVKENGDDTEKSKGETEVTNWQMLMYLEEEFHKIISQKRSQRSDAEYHQWIDEKGVHHIEMYGPPSRPYAYAFEIHPDGSKAISYGNKNPVKMVEEKPGSRIYLIDSNGVFDERLTFTFFEEGNSIFGWFSREEYTFEQRTPDGSLIKTHSIGHRLHADPSDVRKGAW